MVISGITMMIFDSRIIHKWIRTIKSRFQRNQQAENVEPGDEPGRSEAGEQQSELQPVRVDTDNLETAVSQRNQQSQAQQHNNIENSASRVRSDQVKAPYSILTGVAVFAIFVISFIVIIVIRGVVANLPIGYRFFANMYLAGMSQGVSRKLISFRNDYFR